jgi:hypothetical protein
MQGISMPYLLLTLAALFWGNYVVGHILVQGADPILMTEARWALTGDAAGGAHHRQIWKVAAAAPECANAADLNAVWAGEFSFTLYIGLQSTSALNAAIYMSATPAWCLLLIG